MIGNEIEFTYYNWSNIGRASDTKEILTGLVVDAFTKVTGTIRGSSSNAFGFGEGSTTGNIDSRRMYKVQYCSGWDKEKKYKRFIDIYDWQVNSIIMFANAPQLQIEEKIIE